MKPLGTSLWHCQPSLSFWPEQFLAVVALVYSCHKLHQVPFLPHPAARNNPWVCATVYKISLQHAMRFFSSSKNLISSNIFISTLSAFFFPSLKRSLTASFVSLCIGIAIRGNVLETEVSLCSLLGLFATPCFQILKLPAISRQNVNTSVRSPGDYRKLFSHGPHSSKNTFFENLRYPKGLTGRVPLCPIMALAPSF